MGVKYNPGVITNGLVGYWDAANRKSYPGSGTVWNDLSGNGNNLDLTGVTFANNLFSFTSSSDTYANITTPSSTLKPSSGATIGAFIYSTYVSGQQIIIDYQSSGYSGYIMQIYNSALTVNFAYDVNTKDVNSSKILNSNTWYYAMATYDGSYIKIYVNGVLNDNVSATGTITYPSGPFRIGKRSLNDNYKFSGYIASPMIYNRALSAAEISQNYNALRGRYGI